MQRARTIQGVSPKSVLGPCRCSIMRVLVCALEHFTARAIDDGGLRIALDHVKRTLDPLGLDAAVSIDEQNPSRCGALEANAAPGGGT